MDELENDKMIYWFVFFAVLIFLAILGHKYVFSYAEDKQKEKDEIIEDEINIDKYIGVWQFFGDDELPLYELLINVVDGSTITFDYYVNEVAYFESQTAELLGDTANFQIVDRDNLGSAKGKLIFKDNCVWVVITSNDIEGINSGTFQFATRSDENLLN